MVFLGFIQRWMVLRNIRKAERAIKNAQDSKQRSAAIILAVDAIRDAQKKRWLADDTKAKLALPRKSRGVEQQCRRPRSVRRSEKIAIQCRLSIGPAARRWQQVA